jgi:hypothetical protein
MKCQICGSELKQVEIGIYECETCKIKCRVAYMAKPIELTMPSINSGIINTSIKNNIDIAKPDFNKLLKEQINKQIIRGIKNGNKILER